jgi:pyruvate dehydrogenase E2 component (dihydrolipoamide acetyltransferase)
VGDFTMPSLGADMEAGKVVEWLVAPGDHVRRGDIVAVVETEKSTIEVEVFEEGTVEELVVAVGARVPVGAVLARLRSDAGAPPSAAPSTPVSAPSPVAPTPESPPTSPSVARAPSRRGLVESPLVRHLAHERGVDLTALSGTGPGGVVTRADVEHASARPRPSATSGRVRSSPFARRLAREAGVDLTALAGSGPGASVVAADVRRARAAPPSTPADDRQLAMRRAIGSLMARSKREVPHYYLESEIDVGPALAWLEEANERRSIAERLIPSVLLFKATARAVARVPEMNGFYRDGEFTAVAAVHLGLAISQRGGGLIAPAIHDVEMLSLDDLMARVKDLVARTRTGRLRSSEMSDSTMTVTNLGDLGVDSVLGVIYPPQVALVGFGRIRERPWVVDGDVRARASVIATLAADHRVSDGLRGAHFLAEIDRLLQDPGGL